MIPYGVQSGQSRKEQLYPEPQTTQLLALTYLFDCTLSWRSNNTERGVTWGVVLYPQGLLGSYWCLRWPSFTFWLYFPQESWLGSAWILAIHRRPARYMAGALLKLMTTFPSKKWGETGFLFVMMLNLRKEESTFYGYQCFHVFSHLRINIYVLQSTIASGSWKIYLVYKKQHYFPQIWSFQVSQRFLWL